MSSKRKKARRNKKAKTDAPHVAASEEINVVGAESAAESVAESEIIIEDGIQSVTEDASAAENDWEIDNFEFVDNTSALSDAHGETAEEKTDEPDIAEPEESVSEEVEPEEKESEKSEESESEEKTEDSGEAEKSEESHTGKKKQSAAVIILKWVQNVMIAICAAVFLVCIYLLGQNLYEKFRGNQIYKDANTIFTPIIPGEDDPRDINPQYMVRPSAETALATMYDRLLGVGDNNGGGLSSDVIAQLEMMRRSLSELISVNDGVCGWIYVPNTKINYPIARGNDNEYYLSHDYTKQYLAVGTPYVDCENDKDLSKNLNTVIYGHNVSNGTMFHDIEKFKAKDFFEASKVYIYTMEGIYVYTPCSFYSTKDYYQYFRVQFVNDDDFIEFTKEMIANSMFKSDISFQPGDQMLTLSTCTNNIEGDGRYALHLKMTEFITDKTEDTADTGAE